MHFDITTVRKLTGLRNKRGLPFTTKERLSLILNTAEEINREPDPKRREMLLASFTQQWAELAPQIGCANG